MRRVTPQDTTSMPPTEKASMWSATPTANAPYTQKNHNQTTKKRKSKPWLAWVYPVPRLARRRPQPHPSTKVLQDVCLQTDPRERLRRHGMRWGASNGWRHRMAGSPDFLFCCLAATTKNPVTLLGRLLLVARWDRTSPGLPPSWCKGAERGRHQLQRPSSSGLDWLARP